MDLFEALGNGDLETLRAMIGAEPKAANVRNAAGASLLAFAAYMGNSEAIAAIRPALPAIDAHEAIIIGDNARLRALLGAGFNANGLSSDGFTPLGLAAFFRNTEAFELLLPLTRDVNARAENPQRVAAIHAATAVRDAAAVEKLLRAGADPDLEQADGFRPLHAAAQHGDAVITGLLLLFGADPRLGNAKGVNAIEQARAAGHEWLAMRLARAG